MAKEIPGQPPFERSPRVLQLVTEIGEQVGALQALEGKIITPRLRRENRIQTIHSSLAIENNTLSLEQVTAVIEGKPVLGDPREIQEVRNAFAAYEAMDQWTFDHLEDFLRAHAILLKGLVDQAGTFRTGGVGVFRGEQLVHAAPPAGRIPALMRNLFRWLGKTQDHLLVASCVVHYEIEFIHPFADGNGRMGRLWQTVILKEWKPVLANLPVESVIRERQDRYHAVLAESDQEGSATPFVEFMLEALHDSLLQILGTDQVTD